MKRFAMIVVLSSGLVAGPALADHDGRPLLNRENVGGALGAVVGGLVGSELVNGDGKPLATAAGAVGGYIVGRDIGHNYGGNRYSYSGGNYGQVGSRVDYTTTADYRPTESRRSYSGSGGYEPRRYRGSNDYGTKYRAHNEHGCCDDESRRSYPVHPIHEKYVAKCTSNVRAGPGTRYHVMDQVRTRELVTVIGKVRGRNWYKVRVGYRIGYIYAPLLEPTYYGQNRYDDGHGWYR